MRSSSLTALLAVALAAPPTLLAQPRGSERATVIQKVNGVTLTVDFSRPVARGREHLFGGVVHWGELWTPGANWATTLEVDRPIRLDGHEVAPGKYSLWLEPREDGPWRFSLHESWRLYHDSPVPDDGWVLRYDVEPRPGAHMEALNWYVHALAPTFATLRMHWGSTFVSFDVETDEFSWPPLAPEVRESLLGAYAFDTRDPTTGGPLAVTISVLEEEGRLAGRWGGAPIALVPSGDAEFMIGFLRSGALFDVAPELTLRILVEDGRSTGAELLWEGRAFASGEKVR